MGYKTRYLPFILLAVIVLVLISATFIENISGTDIARSHIYDARWFTALWILLTIISIIVIVKSKLYKRPPAFMIHISFVLILSGALTTHITGTRGTVHLRLNEEQSVYEDMKTKEDCQLPFTLKLRRFRIENYPGTTSPMDYISDIDIISGTNTEAVNVSMNNIGKYNHYRLYQSGYDSDGMGTLLGISHDPYGIGITYLGYILLFLSMALLLFSPGEGFRRLIATRRYSAIITGILLSYNMNINATGERTAPKVLPTDIAAQFGDLYLYYNGRICPLQTAAVDFTTKLYGKPTYKGYTSEQVFTGWMLFPTTWIRQPMIKIKGRTKDITGIKGKYASYNDFHGLDGYKLESSLAQIHNGEEVDGAGSIKDADEKMNIILMLFKGELTKIYPYNPAPDNKDKTEIQWFSQGDNLPSSMPGEKWMFTKKSLDYIGELVWMKKYSKLSEVLEKIKIYQKKEAGNVLPSDAVFKAEKLYNTLNLTRPLAITCVTVGILSLLVYLFCWTSNRKIPPCLTYTLNILLSVYIVVISGLGILRGFVSGHLPLANGFETMQFMSLSVFLLTLAMRRKFILVTPFGLLLGGLALTVAMIGGNNPQITPLMPVLSSPLLSIHVCIIMVAYSLFAFTMLNGITAIVLKLTNKDFSEYMSRLQYISLVLLYPAEFCLAAGIFIGAVWANVSWGTYWSWDPKEVWALITLLIYSIPLHRTSLTIMNRPLVFHIYTTLSFLAILMTYFGVNYFLGGMHSYA